MGYKGIVTMGKSSWQLRSANFDQNTIFHVIPCESHLGTLSNVCLFKTFYDNGSTQCHK